MSTTANENFWQVNAQSMQEVVTFLAEQGMIPTTLSVDSDGWAEALFQFPADTSTSRKMWYKLARQGRVELQEPVLEVTNQDGSSALRVQFRIKAEQPKRFAMLRRFIS